MDNYNLGSFSDSWSDENEVRSGESIYSNSRDYTTEFTRGFHNHQVAEYLDGHEYPSRLKPLEK